MFAAAFEAPAAGRARTLLTFLLSAAMIAAVHVAHATIAIALTLDELVRRATAVAVVVPTDRRAVWENDRIVTYTHVRVDRVVAGRVAPNVWVRTFGGAVGNIGQVVEGQATFEHEPSLAFMTLHQGDDSSGVFGVVEGAQGQFALVKDGDGGVRLAAARNGAALVPPPGEPRLARELVGRPLEDAAGEIRAAWARLHPADTR